MTKAATPNDNPAIAINDVKDANAPFFDLKYL